MKKIHLQLLLAQIFTDYLMIIISFSLAYFLRTAIYSFSFPFVQFIFSSDFPFGEYLVPALFLAPLWLIIMYYARGYKIEMRVKNWRHFERIIFVTVVGIAIYLVTFFVLRKVLFSRLIVLLTFFFAVNLIFCSHLLFSALAKSFFSRGIGTFPTLIIGTTREAEKLITHLKKEKSIHDPVAILDGYGAKIKEIAGVKIVGKLNLLEETIQRYHIEQIIQTDNLEQTINIIHFALKHHLKYAMLPTLLGLFKRGSRVEELEGIPVVRA